MIPQSTKITGFRRFKDTAVTLDRQLLAFVGPNEAGKSSFLAALLSLENDNPYSKADLKKGLDLEESDTVVKVTYLLDNNERQKLTDFNGVGEIRKYTYWKTVSGERFHSINTTIERVSYKRDNLSSYISKLLKNNRVRKFLNENSIIEDEEGNNITFFQLLNQLLQNLKNYNKSLSSSSQDIIDNVQNLLVEDLLFENVTSKKKCEELKVLIDEMLLLENEEHPKDRFLKYLDDKRPEFILFSDSDRYLKGKYSIAELATPSNAISNLFSVADITFSDYLNSIKDKDEAERLKLTDRANENLKKEYCSSWSQSKVFPRLLFDPGGINISIISSGNYTEIQSRSDGLKMYIALKSFLSKQEYDNPPVLLIDEAEIHLHYAAQADLVNEFENQNLVNSIIYTTHSAGCLPSDLGSGIRAVKAVTENKNDTNESVLMNSIWQNQGGFSPILFAMGANIIAMTLARKAIIAEGPSETILLPRIFRESSNDGKIDFQIAPGIAEIAQEKASAFEFESAKTSYLVDGEKGGDAIKKKLIKGGINESQIIQLDKGCSLEDYIKSDLLLNALNRELDAWGQNKLNINPKDIPKFGKSKWLENKCKRANLIFPSKVRIAEYLASLPSDQVIIDNKMKPKLKKILLRVEKLLN